ncbi:Ppx/GppA phosphatase family protein [Bartonella tamiae]|uniref:Exopolyphosphatase n=1 Tax=Bartonella tamiae Th239 TaxID=1094558 RepID=J0QS45_9HYPH|nr:Ppx/GppA phosphatase family protein [Bartonella tamiae]EJF88681.1 exopolyphosphatase [Bartonella tamiae Th239]EJF95069.1 exopolyphosphatase [Bartonella tamiae Th307]
MTKVIAQGRLKGRKPIAVIDIGSNSVRLVVYEGLVRAPTVLFNEKILCGLGKGLANTGRLEDQSVDMALRTLKRFRAVCDQIGVESLHTLATAAAREAENGSSFIEEASRILKNEICVLTGKEEAEFSSYGVLSYFFKPNGLVGDLGGGSLELVNLSLDKMDGGVTLPLGGLRLHDLSAGNLSDASKIVQKYLQQSHILEKNYNRHFYAVGGTWRNLAKLHMLSMHYPLPVMHAYEVTAESLHDFLNIIMKGEIDTITGIESISKNRRHLLSYGAIIMNEIIHTMAPEKIIFSGAGVREGFLYSRLPKNIRKQDPLLAACEEMATLRARSPKQAYELIAFTNNAFEVFGVIETENQKRYREAACLLADIGWRFHPDYRGDQSALQIAYGPYPGMSHHGRLFTALSVFFKNEGLFEDQYAPDFIKLASQETIERARFLGGIMRVANLFSASTAGILPDLRWERKKKAIVLNIPKCHENLVAERPIGRLKQLTKITDIALKYQIID